jgi:amidase
MSDPFHAAQCFMPYPAPMPMPPTAGPLSPLRLAVKDIFDVAGYPTGCGNPHALALSGIKTASAWAVAALVDAGAVVVGKACTDELAFSMNGRNAHYGTPRNGGAPDRIPGGSSSGSASAVSNGLADIALGTDTGGSVRAPASHCGLIGIRPTHGRVSLSGAMDLAPDFDTCGWFARDIDTFAQVGEVLLGDDSCPLPAALQVLMASDIDGMLSPRVRAVFAETLGRLAPVLGTVEPVQAVGEPVDALYWAFRHIQGYQAWAQQGERIERYGMQLGPGVKDRFAWSSKIAHADMAQHEAVRRSFNQRFLALLGRDRVLVMPTMPDIAPLLSESEEALDDYRNQAIRMLCLAGLSGCPQISLPLMTLDGAPFGFSLIGPPGSDRSLIALAHRLIDVAS